MYENGYFEALETGFDQGFFDGAMDFYQFLLTHDWSAQVSGNNNELSLAQKL